MRLVFNSREQAKDFSELVIYDTGVVPRYGKGTHKGIFNCPICGRCCGHLIHLGDNKVAGWINLICDCGHEINWRMLGPHIC